VVKRSISSKKEKTKAPLPPRECKGCGVVFTPSDRREHYHSENCRESYYQRTYYAGASATKTCANCGVEFTTTKPGRQDYCTPECREDHRRKKIIGVNASVNAERITYRGDRFATLERDKFRCRYCGKGGGDGVKLDVESDGEGGLRTVCSECVEGREFNKAQE